MNCSGLPIPAASACCRHRIGDTDKGIRPSCGHFFNGDIKRICNGTLIRMKRKAVNGMDHRRVGRYLALNALRRCILTYSRQTPENTGLCRMGMNNIRLQSPQMFFDFTICDKIFYRVNRPYQFINDYHFVFLILCLLKSPPSGPIAGPVISVTSWPRSASSLQVMSVFSCPAENQPSYDVYNPHRLPIIVL